MSGWHFASHLSHGGYTLLSMSYGRVSRANVWRFALLSLLILRYYLRKSRRVIFLLFLDDTLLNFTGNI